MMDDMMALSDSAAAAIFFDQTVQDYRPFLESISLPTVLCFGKDPKMMPPEAGQHLKEKILNSSLHIFELSGHCPFIEEPERFNSMVFDFARTISDPKGASRL